MHVLLADVFVKGVCDLTIAIQRYTAVGARKCVLSVSVPRHNAAAAAACPEVVSLQYACSHFVLRPVWRCCFSILHKSIISAPQFVVLAIKSHMAPLLFYLSRATE